MNELTQLKAKAYDILAAIEDLSKQLQAVNAEIAKHYQPAEQEETQTEEK